MRHLLLFFPFVTICAAAPYQLESGKEPLPGLPYDCYHTQDRLQRRITFCMTNDGGTKLPLVVSILGSGAHSNFVRRDGKLLDGHLRLREVFRGIAHVLVVE